MNGCVTVDEFDMLVQLLAPQTYSLERTYDLFVEYADIAEDNIECLSMESMAAMAAKYKLFGAESQSRFLGRPISSAAFDDEYVHVKKSLDDIKQLLHDRLMKARIYDSVWENRLNEFVARVHDTKYTHKCMYVWYNLG